MPESFTNCTSERYHKAFELSFRLSDEEGIKLTEDFKVLVGRVLVAGIQSLSFLKSVIPEHIPHKYQEEMSEK